MYTSAREGGVCTLYRLGGGAGGGWGKSVRDQVGMWYQVRGVVPGGGGGDQVGHVVSEPFELFVGEVRVLMAVS